MIARLGDTRTTSTNPARASMVESRPERGRHAPGTFYYYNSWDFNVAGTIFRQLTGQDIFTEFATARAASCMQ